MIDWCVPVCHSQLTLTAALLRCSSSRPVCPQAYRFGRVSLGHRFKPVRAVDECVQTEVSNYSRQGTHFVDRNCWGQRLRLFTVEVPIQKNSDRARPSLAFAEGMGADDTPAFAVPEGRLLT